MEQYIYKPEECGLKEWPAGTLRLTGFDITENPKDADLFVYPGALHGVSRNAVHSLKHMKGHESRHVFFHCSDEETLFDLPCLFIRCNTRTWYYAKDPNTISWPWPVEDFAECIEPEPGGFQFDVSFQGWVSTETRRISMEACQASSLKCDIAAYADFTGYIYHEPEGIRRRKEFRRSMKQSRVALCGESIPGVFPYRFFEAMSAGRVPLLIGTDYCLPFQDEIPYDEFILRLPASEADRAADVIQQFIQSHTDTQILEMGRLGRYAFERRLNRDDWPQLMAYAVEKKMKELGL